MGRKQEKQLLWDRTDAKPTTSDGMLERRVETLASWENVIQVYILKYLMKV